MPLAEKMRAGTDVHKLNIPLSSKMEMSKMIIAEQIKGHEDVKSFLEEALSQNRLPHALLFSGPSGVGKRQMAHALAQSLLCSAKEACGHCQSCLSVFKKQSADILYVSHETLQIRLRDVQPVPRFLSLQTFAPAKIVMIDSAEILNLQAVNFLLKMIEEPPAKSFFFFISPVPSKLPLTMRSRLQNVRFQALPENVVKELAPPGAPEWMIRGSRGRIDLLLELWDQKEMREHSFRLWSKAMESAFLNVESIRQVSKRKEALTICRFWQEMLRDARFLKAGRPDKMIHGDKQEEIKKISAWPGPFLDLLIREALKMEADLRANVNSALCFENFALSLHKKLRIACGLFYLSVFIRAIKAFCGI